MVFTDIMCNRVAKEIIDTMFMVNYTPTIDDSKTWYANLNGFLVKEYLHLSAKSTDDMTEEDMTEEDIVCNTCYKYIIKSYGYYCVTHDTKKNENVCDICWDEHRRSFKKGGYISTNYEENGNSTIINYDDYNDDGNSSDEDDEYEDEDEDEDDDEDTDKDVDRFTNLSSELEDHQSEIFNKVDNDCENVIDELSIVSEQNNKPFTDNEEDTIVSDAFDILCDTLNIDDDEFEEFEHEVDWTRFDDIIHYYIDMLETKCYNTEQFKSNQCAICNTYYNYDTTSVINNIHVIVENKCFECYMK